MSIFDAPLNKFLVKISVAVSVNVLFCITFTKTINRWEHCHQSVITFYAGINYTRIHIVPKAGLDPLTSRSEGSCLKGQGHDIRMGLE